MVTRSRYRLVIALWIGVAAGLWDCRVNAQSNSEGRHAVGAIAESYLAHRESFPNLRVEFTWTRVHSSSLDLALTGDFIKHEEPIHGLMITADGRTRYDLLRGPSATAEFDRALRQDAGSTTNGGVGAVPCLSDQRLMANGYTLSFGPMSGIANLFPPDLPDGFGIRVSPFNLETMGSNETSNPGRFLRDGLSGRFSFEYLGSVTPNDAALTVVITSDRFENRFSFDPVRSYILAATSMTARANRKRVYEMRLLDAEECSGGRWLPTHGVSLQHPDGPGPPLVLEMKVTSFDADYHPDPAEMTLDLPPNTQVNIIGQTAWARTDKEHPERFGPDDLPSLHKRCIAHGEDYVARQKTADAISGERGLPRPVSALYVWLVFFINAAVLAYVAWRFIRRGRAR